MLKELKVAIPKSLSAPPLVKLSSGVLLLGQMVFTQQSARQCGKKRGESILSGMILLKNPVRKWKQLWNLDLDLIRNIAVPATYACIFGISEGTKGVEKGTMTSVLNEHFSYLIPSGPGKRTYWFLVRNMGKTYYGADIPRFSKEEEVELAKEHWDDQLTPSLRFSDLYTSKIASVYTTLPEYVFKKWHFRRIMTIGDASHKVRCPLNLDEGR